MLREISFAENPVIRILEYQGECGDNNVKGEEIQKDIFCEDNLKAYNVSEFNKDHSKFLSDSESIEISFPETSIFKYLDTLLSIEPEVCLVRCVLKSIVFEVYRKGFVVKNEEFLAILKVLIHFGKDVLSSELFMAVFNRYLCAGVVLDNEANDILLLYFNQCMPLMFLKSEEYYQCLIFAFIRNCFCQSTGSKYTLLLIKQFLSSISSDIVMNNINVFSQVLIHIRRHNYSIQEFAELKDSIFSLFRKVSMNTVLSSLHADAISAFILISFEGIFDKDVFKYLTELIENKHFSITRSLIQVYGDNNQFSEAFSYIMNLLLSKPESIIECHRSGLDSFIIDLIESKKMDIEKHGVLIGMTMQIFERIASIVSSSEVVEKYINLLNPNKDSLLSVMHSSFVASLDQMISLSLSKPITYMPLKEEKLHVEANKLAVCQIESGFSFSFWLNIPNDDSSSQIFSLNDSQKMGLSLVIENKSIQIIVRYPDSEAIVTLGTNVPLNEWFFLLMKIEHNNNDLILHSTINNSIIDPIQTKWTELDRTNPITILVGGSDSPALLGPFGFYTNEVVPSYKDGPRIMFNEPSLLYIVPNVCNNRLYLEKSNASQTIVQISGNDTKSFLSFADCLIRVYKISIFFPLLLQLDYKYINGDDIPSFGDAIVNLILRGLMLSSESRSDFILNEGFSIIYRLLMKSTRKHLTYSLYLRFFVAFETINDLSFRESILKDIILNFSLWVHSEYETQDQIARHWSRFVFKKYCDISLKVLPFENLLMCLRKFYWYEPVEESIAEHSPVSKYPRIEGMNVYEIRQNLIQILHSLSINKKFEESSFRSIIAHCVTCQDKKQVCDLLSLLKLIAVSEDVPLANVKESWGLFNSLHLLLSSPDEDIIFSVLEVFCSLHVLEFITHPKIFYHVNSLLQIIPSSIYTKAFIAKLIPLTMKFHDFLPMVFYSNIIVKGAYESLIMKHLQPSIKFAEKKKTWIIWPIISGLLSSNAFMEYTFDFIAKCSNENWHFSFMTIEAIARALRVDDQKPKSIFLHKICDSMLAQPLLSYEYLHTYYDITMYHMMFRPFDHIPKHIDSLLKIAGFESYEIIERSDCSYRFEKKDFLQNLTSLSNQDIRYKYGLRMNSEGKWDDCALAISVIKQARRTKVLTFHNFAAMIAGFSIQDNIEEAQPQIDGLLSSSILDGSFIRIIHRHDPRFKNEKKQSDIEIFEKRINEMTPYIQEVLSIMPQVIEAVNKVFKKSDEAMFDIFQSTDSTLFTYLLWNMKNEEIRILKSEENKHEHYLSTMKHMSSISSPWRFSNNIEAEKTTRLNPTSFLEYCPVGFEAPLQSTPLTKNKYKPDQSQQLSIVNLSYIPDSGTNPIIEFSGRYIKLSQSYECKIFVYLFQILIEYSPKQYITLIPTEITQVLARYFYSRPTGLEFYTRNEGSFLIDLISTDCYSFLSTLSSMHCWKEVDIQTTGPCDYIKSKLYTEQWANGKISTFKYLMYLNMIGGRSFHDLSMYPIFPWVLIPSNSSFDNNNTKHFRDFSKFIGEKGYPSSSHHVANLIGTVFSDNKEQNNLSIMSIYEDNLSKEGAFELIPEFYQSETFLKTSFNGQIPWGIKDYRSFIQIQREALESSYVSERINQWIDLIFGVNRKARLEILADTLDDDCQFPQELFKEPHIKRSVMLPYYSRITTNNNAGDVVHDIKKGTIDCSNNGTVSGLLVLSDRSYISFEYLMNDEYVKKEGVFKFSSIPHHLLMSGKYSFAGMNDGRVIKIDLEAASRVFHQTCHFAVNSMSQDNSYLVSSSGYHTNIYDIKTSLIPLHSLPSLSGIVESSYLDSEINLVASVTEHGYLSIINLLDGYPASQVSMKPLLPKKVIISKTFGRIVVFSKSQNGLSMLSFYETDGTLVKHEEIKIDIKLMKGIQSFNGKNSIVACSNNDSIYLIDPITCSISESLYQSLTHVLDMVCRKTDASMIALLDNGELLHLRFE